MNKREQPVSQGFADLIGVSSFDIDHVWDRVLPFVQSALETSFDAPEDIHKALKTKAAQLWLAWLNNSIEAVCITRVEEYTRGHVCDMWICTGTGRKDWQHHLNSIENWARSNGCVAMKLVGRPGWQRMLEPGGYKATHIVLEKDL